jgi:hypothetical protein
MLPTPNRTTRCVLFLVATLLSRSTAWLPTLTQPPGFRHAFPFLASRTSADPASLETHVALLTRAADTKTEDSEQVYTALAELETLMRRRAREDYPATAEATLRALDGDWRLVFTTGTAQTQQKYGKINYFPIKAVQSFRTTKEPMEIENGIYFGDFPAVRFSGTMEFDLQKRKLEFDFDKVLLLNFFDVTLKKGEAANLGAKSGLGSESNVVNTKRDKKAFFNWISADENIATARGGGGGLALWKRIPSATPK